MKSNVIKLFLVIAASSLTSGCATVFSGSTQNLNIKVIDSQTHNLLEGVHCESIDSGGAQYVLSSNPGVIHVKRGDGNISIFCKKDGYRQLNTAVGDSFNAVTVANVLFWPGFLVDGLSGAYKKYPSHYVVTMEKIK